MIDGTLGEDESSKFSFTVLTTESCTTTSLMTAWNLRTICNNFKNNNNEHWPVDL